MNRLFKSLFLMNSLSLILGTIYTLFPGESLFWNSYGILLLVTLTGNILASVSGSGHRKLDLTYLLLSSFGLLGVLLLNTFASVSPTNESSRSLLSNVMLLVLLINGALITGRPFLHKKDRVTPSADLSGRGTSKTSRKITTVFLGLLLFFGVLLAFILVTDFSVGIIEVVVSPYSLFFSFIFLSIAGLYVKLSEVRWRSFKGYLVSAIGAFLFLIFALPFFYLPSLLDKAEADYTEAFGDEWQTHGEKVSAFRDLPVSLPAFFFGIPSEGYELTEDVLYYEGTEGVDAGLELRFDVYTPSMEAADLPGEGSTLIRIHGGGWDSGDKGAGNFAQFNKYFASQGYVVFDVQYGLDDKEQFVGIIPTPEEVSGDFSIDDMVRHLGLFTTYLADNHETYGADIASVFISGGSAGGHLANALALGSSSGEYTDIIDSRMSVNGIIPLYPANDLASFRNLSGEEALVDPKLLVDQDSPPALIYQGENDSLVEPQVAENFKEAYLEKGNSEVAIIEMPYGSHASDMYFPGFYSQSFLYYMERFMYQYR
ncbi:alpha/beta hydrolase [Alkalibacterium sp. 20]|uniref:alpha/beta hydrolase n=1 Tax=Alkalibacterium sp. 20 TaxID=1798803 RepID=UPI0009000506|nr:alpha/beta hydrolase [Alkalibacterium sp. 20]OJF92819.1 hypothetical protein AX762_09550 [Alkalibacterium sp. 20]